MELLNIIIEDYRKENFTSKEWLVYGLLAPLALTAVCILASA